MKYDENCSHKLTIKFWGEKGSGPSFENLKCLCLAKLLIVFCNMLINNDKSNKNI